MRIAILPITSFRHLAGESEVVMFTNQIRSWVHEQDDVWAYIVLPEDCKEQGWAGEREEWPRCSVVWEDRLGLYYDKVTELPATFLDTFNPRHGRYQIDALVTSRRAAAATYARQLWDHRLKQPLPVFIDESMTVEWGRTPSTVSDIEIVAQTLGYATCWPVWDTQDQRLNALEAARHWLAGAKVLQVMQKGVVIPCGFDPARIDRIMAENEIEDARYMSRERLAEQKAEKFTCFFGGAVEPGEQAGRHLAA